jgi:hypothetical protein
MKHFFKNKKQRLKIENSKKLNCINIFFLKLFIEILPIDIIISYKKKY